MPFSLHLPTSLYLGITRGGLKLNNWFGDDVLIKTEKDRIDEIERRKATKATVGSNHGLYTKQERDYFDAVNNDQDFNDALAEKFNASTEQDYKDADVKLNRIENAFLQKFTNFYEK